MRVLTLPVNIVFALPVTTSFTQSKMLWADGEQPGIGSALLRQSRPLTVGSSGGARAGAVACVQRFVRIVEKRRELI